MRVDRADTPRMPPRTGGDRVGRTAGAPAATLADAPVARVSAAHPRPRPSDRHPRRPPAPAALAANRCDSPRIHDLCVPPDDGSPPAIYRVFEAHAGNVDATCRALHGRDWLAERIAPIVLVHGRLSTAQVARLPRRVPWISVRGTVADTLDVLRDALVAPLLEKGWICVDFMDYAAALGHGGELRCWRATGTTAAEAAATLVEQATADLRTAPELAALCLHVGLPLHGTMDDFNAAATALEGLLDAVSSSESTAQPMTVVAVTTGPMPGFQLSVLAMVPSSCRT